MQFHVKPVIHGDVKDNLVVKRGVAQARSQVSAMRMKLRKLKPKFD